MNTEKNPFVKSISRRSFLKKTTFAFLALGAITLFRWGYITVRQRIPARRLNYFTDKEAFILESVAGVILPGVDGMPSARDIKLIERIDAEMSDFLPSEREDFKSLLFAFEYFAPVLGPAIGPFTSLSHDGKIAYLRGWEQSRWAFKRTVFQALKQTILLYYYDDERTWKGLGYGGPWVTSMGWWKEREKRGYDPSS